VEASGLPRLRDVHDVPIQDCPWYTRTCSIHRSAERLFSLIDAVPEISTPGAAGGIGSIRADIEFDKVISINKEGQPVLCDFTPSGANGRDDCLWDRRGRKVHDRESSVPVLRADRWRDQDRGRNYLDLPLTPYSRGSEWCCSRAHLFSGRSENIRYGALTRRTMRRRCCPGGRRGGFHLAPGQEARTPRWGAGNRAVRWTEAAGQPGPGHTCGGNLNHG